VRGFWSATPQPSGIANGRAQMADERLQAGREARAQAWLGAAHLLFAMCALYCPEGWGEAVGQTW
jgi:hypothetical protein